MLQDLKPGPSKMLSGGGSQGDGSRTSNKGGTSETVSGVVSVGGNVSVGGDVSSAGGG